MINSVRIKADKAIIEAAFQTWGRNPKAPLSEVAIAAGVGRATLHRYFSGREDLLRVLAEQAAGELEETANSAAKQARSYTDALHKIMTALVPLGERQWFLMNGTLQQVPEIQAKLDRQNKDLVDVFKRAQREGLYPETCPIEWVMKSYDLMIYNAWCLVRDGHATPKQASSLAWNTFVHGIKKAKI